jgi:hypothetical protein
MSGPEDFANAVRERLARIETRLDNIERTFATKEDLRRDLHAITWKLIGACTVLVAAVYFIARTVH